jgi:16S rRNA (cytosine967-C5)-methyltransferase
MNQTNKSPRIHKHLLNAVISCLQQSFDEGFYIDKVIERAFKQNKKWGSRDRKFVAESCYEITRWWRKLNEALGIQNSLNEEDLLKVFGLWWLSAGHELPQWDEFDIASLKKALDKYESYTTGAVAASIPDFIYELYEAELGDETDLALRAMNEQAKIVLRANELKLNRESLQKELEKENISTIIVDNFPSALVLTERANVFRTEAFKKGYFEVQDGASQSVAPLLGVEPGMRVVDACAGAGGKSLHLAAMMQNKGSLIALDIHEHKLKELKKRAKRAGASNIETRAIESTKVIKRLHEKVDRLLLDVPCSGLGVLRRNPDTKWKLSKERIAELIEIQSDIIERYSKMLKPGGQMIYATCSVLRSENEDQVEKFLANNQNWSLIKQERHWPHKEGFDGFYAALLQKGE